MVSKKVMHFHGKNDGTGVLTSLFRTSADEHEIVP